MMITIGHRRGRRHKPPGAVRDGRRRGERREPQEGGGGGRPPAGRPTARGVHPRRREPRR